MLSLNYLIAENRSVFNIEVNWKYPYHKVFVVILVLFLFQFVPTQAQDTRTQYAGLLSKAYFDLNIGYINYPFTTQQLEPGYSVESIDVPHTAVRFVLFGYNFNKYLAAQITYMRPVSWVRYNNINGDQSNHPVFMNVGGLTAKGQYPIFKKLKIYGEAGLGIITRKGFSENDNPDKMIVTNANYATWLFGGGLKYQVGRNWELEFSTSYSPPNSSVNQPYTVFYGGGFSFTLNPVLEENVKANANSGYIFPKQMIQIGYSTNAFGYGVNDFFSEGAIPVFWGGYAEVKNGITVHYQRNVFHTRKVFSLDWGASFSYYVSNEDSDKFWTLSLFPVLRFTVVHFKPLDIYLNYSVAGPTYISKSDIDGYETGPKFTFQDFMGMGLYIGKDRRINAEVRIAHYSNGNLFPENEGVKIPLTFNLGYTF